jgi:hypothetical protein
MRDLRGGDAFRKPDGRPLTGNSLRKAILAKLKSRELADRIDITGVTEKHGKPMFLVKRRHELSADRSFGRAVITAANLIAALRAVIASLAPFGFGDAFCHSVLFGSSTFPPSQRKRFVYGRFFGSATKQL